MNDEPKVKMTKKFQKRVKIEDNYITAIANESPSWPSNSASRRKCYVAGLLPSLTTGGAGYRSRYLWSTMPSC